jgi:hypothetical protein
MHTVRDKLGRWPTLDDMPDLESKRDFAWERFAGWLIHTNQGQDIEKVVDEFFAQPPGTRTHSALVVFLKTLHPGTREEMHQLLQGCPLNYEPQFRPTSSRK